MLLGAHDLEKGEQAAKGLAQAGLTVRPAWASTKAAVNMLTVKYANAFHDDPELAYIEVTRYPGYVATDLNDFKGFRTTEQGARTSVHCATVGDDTPTGGFYDEDGPAPW